MRTLLDIEHEGKIYRPFDKSMADGWDKVKSGKVRPYGWDHYLFTDGWVVFDSETGKFLNSIEKLPRFGA